MVSASLSNTLLSEKSWLSLQDFYHFLKEDEPLTLCPEGVLRLEQTERFINHLLFEKVRVYGLTTGFADLRNKSVNSDEAALLSYNLIQSHDAGIGDTLSKEVTLGAMYLRAFSLAKGYSGFSVASLETLLGMINARIIPEIPSTGSLGASGDLAFLARLGRAMMGEAVFVHYKNQRMLASDALKSANILPFRPKAKEGLALTNGTTFMASMLAIAYQKEINFLENLLALEGLFLQSVGAASSAYAESIHNVRYHRGQSFIAKILHSFLNDSESKEVQNDYSIRCLPQIFGPKYALILEQKKDLENEMNAVTDNPLIFRGHEVSADLPSHSKIFFEGIDWAVISGGNFHGENLATVADIIAVANAKMALTVERQITYLLNPLRNQSRFPIYLISDPSQAGLRSGFMIPQYTANALTHKISFLAHPASTTNITSANESEDVVSYGATAAQKLLKQIGFMEELLSIYLIVVAQSYSLARKNFVMSNELCEKLFDQIHSHISFPRDQDESFSSLYQTSMTILQSGGLSKGIGLTLQDW